MGIYVKKTICLVAAFLLPWLLGLFLFIRAIPEVPNPIIANPDAVVILTGGTMRLEEGLELFEKMHAHKLLISGVGKGFAKSDILALVKHDSAIYIDDIVLGELAETTSSNALEANIFMTLHAFKSMLVVTSNYHIIRTKAIFEAMMPEFEIEYYPVCSDNFKKTTTFISWPSFKVTVSEYNKLLGFYAMFTYEWMVVKSDILFYPLYKYVNRRISEIKE